MWWLREGSVDGCSDAGVRPARRGGFGRAAARAPRRPRDPLEDERAAKRGVVCRPPRRRPGEAEQPGEVEYVDVVRGEVAAGT